MQRSLRPTSCALLFSVIWIGFWTASILAEEPIWVSKGPEGGDVRVVAYDPKTPSRVYAGTWGGGVFRSLDGGANWTRINQGLTNLVVTCVAVNPVNPSNVLVGTFEGGIFWSTNGGDSWASSNVGLLDYRVWALAIDPQQPNTVYAGTQEEGIFRSTNGGGSWAQRSSGLGSMDIYSLVVDPTDSSRIYAGSHQGSSYRSENGGNSWTSLSGGLPGHVVTWAINPETPSIIFAGVGWSDGALYRSTDDGSSWEALRYSGMPQYFGAGSVVLDPENPSNVYAAGSTLGGGIFRSRDGGDHWKNITGDIPPTQPHVHSLAINPADPLELLAGTRIAGVYKTTNSGDSWTPANRGLAAHTVQTISTVTNSPTVVYAGSNKGGILRSGDNGRTWDHIPVAMSVYLATPPAIASIAFDPTDSSTVYAGVGGGLGGLLVSEDGFDTWEGTSNPLLYVSAVAVDPVEPGILYTGGWGMERSDDNGETWVAINSGLKTYSISSIAVDPANPSTLYVCSNYDWTPGVSRSTDRGETWTQVHTNMANQVVIDPETPSTVYFATPDNGVFRSTNGGANWSQVNTGLTNKSVFSLAIDPNSPSTIYAGTDGGGVFRSTNGGSSWTAINQGLDVSQVLSLAVESNVGAVWAGTEGSLYRLEVPEEEYLLNFAQFGDGKSGATFITSQIWLLNLSDSSHATAVVSLRAGSGNALNVDLNGQDVSGEVTVSIPADGVAVLETDGEGPLQAGSVVVSSNQPLAGVIVFAGNAGVAGVGSSEASANGFLAPVESNKGKSINTGIAIMSLEGSDVTVTVTLYDSDRTQLAIAQIELPPMGQLARFLNELEWQGSAPDFSDFRGQIIATPSGRISGTVLQTHPGEFLTMPVTLTKFQPAQNDDEKLYFAQFADGTVGNSSIFSGILLMNLDSSQSANANLSLRKSDGTAMTVDLNGESVAGEKSLVLPAGALRNLETDGKGTLAVGTVTVTCDKPLAGVVVFGGPVGLASVGSSQTLDQGFTAPMEASDNPKVSTGIAVMNLENSAVKLNLQLLDLDGKLLATAQEGLVPMGQIALFVHEFEWDVQIDFSKFRGRLDVTADGLIAATVIQTRPGQFATMPVASK